jgi:iron complex outermembrane receptor protein
MVVAGGGSRGVQTNVRHGGSLANGGAFRMHARHFYMKRSETENGSDVEDAWRMSHAGFRLDWQDGGDTFSANGQVQQGEQEQAAPGIFEIRGLPLELLPVKSRAVNLTARWQHPLSGGGEISTQAYVDHTERTVPIAFDQKLTISDLQFQYVRPRSGRHGWVIGGEYRVASDRVANSSFIGFIPRKATQEWISVFAQDEINLRKDLRLILGGRLESNDYTGVEWLPNARLAWKPSHEHLLWMAMSRSVRAPSRIDRDAFIPYPAAFPWPLLGFTGPRPAYLLGGGREVKAEVAKVMSVGWRGQPTPDTSLSITGYRALYEHLHTQELGGSRGLLIFAGRMRGFTSGLEAWGTWQARQGWRISGGFNGMYQRFYLNSDSTDTTESLPLAEGRDPARTWQLRSAWDLPAGHEIDLTVRHVAWIARDAVPSYVTADLRWGWHMRPGVELSLTGRNLIGRGHAEYLAASTRSFWRPSVHVQAVVRF